MRTERFAVPIVDDEHGKLSSAVEAFHDGFLLIVLNGILPANSRSSLFWLIRRIGLRGFTWADDYTVPHVSVPLAVSRRNGHACTNAAGRLREMPLACQSLQKSWLALAVGYLRSPEH